MPVLRWWPRLVLILVFTLPTFAGNHRWTVDGPFGGGIAALEYDPGDPTIVYAATNNGMFRSADGGQHWTAAPQLVGRGMTDIEVAKSDPNIVYAGSVWGLYKSSDRGLTWQQVNGYASFAVAVSDTDANLLYTATTAGPMRSDDGGVTFGAIGNGLANLPGVSSMALDPVDPDIIYISTYGDPAIFRSADGGANWTPISNGITPSGVAHTIAVHPTTPQTLYAGTLGAMYRSLDSGASWTKLHVVTPTTSMSAYEFAISPALPFTIYAATERGVIRSTNNGSSWVVPLQASSALTMAVDPVHPQNVLAAINFDLYRSTDGASTFTRSHEGLTSYYTDTIAVDSRNPSLVYASGPSGFERSTDRGKTWTHLSNLRMFNVTADPANASILYGLTDGTVRRSTDGGVTWPHLGGGSPVFGGVIHDLEVDPRNGGTVYILLSGTFYRRAATGTWELPGNELPNGQLLFLTFDSATATLYAGSGDALYKSTNGGNSWTPLMTGHAMIGTSVDPFDANHLFAWSNAHVVFESRDGGTNWITRPGLTVNIEFDPSARGVLYAHFSGVLRSTDGGATFGAMGPQDGTMTAQAFAIAPDGNTVYTGASSAGVWAYDFGRRRAAGH